MTVHPQSPTAGASLAQDAPHIIAITPNPALDVTVTLEQLVVGNTHRIPAAGAKVAGKGVNVATVAAEQGYPAVLLGPLAPEEHRYATWRGWLDQVSRLGIAQLFSPTTAPLRSTYAIHETKHGDASIINERGSAHPQETWEHLLNTVREQVNQHPGSVVTVSGSWPPETPVSVLESIIALAHSAGARVVVDCAGEFLTAAAAAGADVLKPNRAELAETVGFDDPVRGARELLNRGAGAVIVSCGAAGLYWITPTESQHGAVETVLAGNPTGAGDALVSAVATALLEQLPIAAALERAVAWSAAAVLQPVAGCIGTAWKDLQVRTAAVPQP